MHCTHCDQAGYVCEAELCVEEGECDAERPCEAADAVCELPSYANCEYCDLEAKECKPGCEEDSNCPGDYYCTDHYCVTQEYSSHRDFAKFYSARRRPLLRPLPHRNRFLNEESI